MNKSKYRARKVEVDGIIFDSHKEARRYRELKLLEQAGKIKDLGLQPNFLLQPSYKKDGKTIRKIEYIADFTYYDLERNEMVVEDVKGFRTDVYRLKKKKFEYKFPEMKITEV